MLDRLRTEYIAFDRLNGLQRESEEFEAAAIQSIGYRKVYCWSQPKSLVVPNNWTRYSGFDLAVNKSSENGWPVSLRKSGGGCVFHGPGVLNVTEIIVSDSGAYSNEDLYVEFCHNVIQSLAKFSSANLTYGFQPKAPCDGRYNILAERKKIAGTAIRRRSLSDKDIILRHACIWLSGDITPAILQIEAFERQLGFNSNYHSRSMITLSEITKNIVVTPQALNLKGDANRAAKSF